MDRGPKEEDNCWLRRIELSRGRGKHGTHGTWQRIHGMAVQLFVTVRRASDVLSVVTALIVVQSRVFASICSVHSSRESDKSFNVKWSAVRITMDA